MAETGRMTTNNIAHAFGGSEITVSLQELLNPGKIETRSAEEIKEHIKKGLAGLVNKHEHESL